MLDVFHWKRSWIQKEKKSGKVSWKQCTILIWDVDCAYSIASSTNYQWAATMWGSKPLFHHTYVKDSLFSSRVTPASTIRTHQTKGSQYKWHLRSPTVSCLPLSFLFGCTSGANETARIFLLSHVFCPVLKICVSCIRTTTTKKRKKISGYSFVILNTIQADVQTVQFWSTLKLICKGCSLNSQHFHIPRNIFLSLEYWRRLFCSGEKCNWKMKS